MEIAASSLASRDAYRLLIACVVPRPVAWIGTVDAEGRPNLAPFSFFAGVTASPPTVMVGIGRSAGRRKDTAANLLATAEAVVHVAPRRLAKEMMFSSIEAAHGVDEAALAGLARVPSVEVIPGRIAGAPLAMEVRVSQHLEVGDGPTDVFLLRILRFHVADEVLAAPADPAAGPDPVKLDAVGRLGGDAYCATTDVFRIPRPPRP
jgi:flavin reductase (DIM6/NTAB) family NADH-FMN oxidoreductase RutF